MTAEGRTGGRWRAAFVDTAAESIGRSRRHDPHLDGTGGPAGNARLTAWTGLILLVLFLGELVTLLDVEGLITWHVVLGALLMPPALVKTASTGWRIVRYYTGNRAYRVAGPPPLPLRILGPLVVATTLGVLASGVLLLALGPDGSRNVLLSAVGQRVDWVTVHQVFFVLWAVATGLHVIGRMVPAVRLTFPTRWSEARVDGTPQRAAVLASTAAVAGVTAFLLVAAASGWRHGPYRFDHGRPGCPAPQCSPP